MFNHKSNNYSLLIADVRTIYYARTSSRGCDIRLPRPFSLPSFAADEAGRLGQVTQPPCVPTSFSVTLG